MLICFWVWYKFEQSFFVCTCIFNIAFPPSIAIGNRIIKVWCCWIYVAIRWDYMCVYNVLLVRSIWFYLFVVTIVYRNTLILSSLSFMLVSSSSSSLSFSLSPLSWYLLSYYHTPHYCFVSPRIINSCNGINWNKKQTPAIAYSYGCCLIIVVGHGAVFSVPPWLGLRRCVGSCNVRWCCYLWSFRSNGVNHDAPTDDDNDDKDHTVVDLPSKSGKSEHKSTHCSSFSRCLSLLSCQIGLSVYFASLLPSLLWPATFNTDQ